MMRFIYSCVGIALTPFLYFWLRHRAAHGKEDMARIRERFGHSDTPRPNGHVVWLHAASVGETQSVLTLVRGLLAKGAALHLVITTGTTSSAKLVASSGLPRVIHHYMPLDTAPAVRRFLNHWQPTMVLWVESELWPQHLWNIHARCIPLLLINARMSARSFTGWQRWPRLATSLLNCFETIYAGAAEDAQRLRTLGASRVIEAGNLKYDAAPLAVDPRVLELLEARCGERRVWLAASTHANEEMMVGQVHQQLRISMPELLTILVPRHATRGDAIAAELRAQGLNVAQRSKNEAIHHTTDVYLADTMGELGSFYRFCNVVFLGGSLVAHGGQNPLEAARHHCALITGLHTHNFSSIVEMLETQHALRRVRDVSELAAAIRELLNDHDARTHLAQNAATAVENAKGASTVILNHVMKHVTGQ